MRPGGQTAAAALPVLRCVLTCPCCGAQTQEAMPTDACLYFYHCPACDARLHPKPGDCCVFCSFGDSRCPPMQMQAGPRCCPGQG